MTSEIIVCLILALVFTWFNASMLDELDDRVSQLEERLGRVDEHEHRA